MLPAEIIGLEHPILAYWFNETVAWFGQYVENCLQQKDPHTGKALYTAEALLGIEAEAVTVDLS